MRKLLTILTIMSIVAVANAPAQITVTGFVVEDEVQAGNTFTGDTAFEPAVLGYDTTNSLAFFGENNNSGGIARVFSYPITADDSTDVATELFTTWDNSGAPGGGTVQTALATTNTTVLRQGGAQYEAPYLYFCVSDTGATTDEFVVDTDLEHVLRYNTSTTAMEVVTSDPGIVSVAVIGNDMWVELDSTAGAATDGIGHIDLSGSLPASATTAVDTTELLAVVGGATIDLRGIAPFGSGVIASVVHDAGTSLVTASGAAASLPTLAEFAAEGVVDGTSLGAISAAAIDTTQNGEIIVFSCNSGGTGPPSSEEGFIHFGPAGAVKNVITAATFIAGSDLGAGADTVRNFDQDEIEAWDNGSDVFFLAASQDNEEFIALVTITGGVPVELSAFQLD